MKANDRARLTSALRDHVGKIAADLRAKMQAPGDTRTRAQQLHADEQVGEDFEVWTDLLSRRAAVLWVLKSVYVRVLEDRGLLTPGRLLDQEAQQLFERLAPHLGETAFLRWVYRDLASPHGGLPELFSPQPAEVALPSDDLSRALITFWRLRDADTGATWSFAEERFEGELMGDLYQELDPVVKNRFALCQTPDFVRTFILDRTLAPAMETFGAEEVRLLDPACGSGHFLIDGLKRLVTATAAKHPDWERGKVVVHALDRVAGIDLNDYACALARARLIMTAAELAGVTKLADAARYHPHVYWADALEQVERDEVKPSLQFSLFEKVEEKPRATLTRSDVRAALKKMFATKFHAVVANPPYISESDDARKAYHREKRGTGQRYVSAYREYSLVGPFIERSLNLSENQGYLGVIVGNGFTRARFGQPLIEKVLATVDVSHIIDTSYARIPDHDTPTAILLMRNRPATSQHVAVLMGKRGDTGGIGTGDLDPAWRAIVSADYSKGESGPFASVDLVDRVVTQRWPWSFSGGTDAVKVFRAIDKAPGGRLKDLLEDAGAVTVTRCDPVFVAPQELLATRVEREFVRTYVTGQDVRDWQIDSRKEILVPYQMNETQSAPIASASQRVVRHLLPYRILLEQRVAFGKTQLQHGKQWFEYSMLFPRRLRGLRLTYADIATHNHFSLQPEGAINNSHAPVLLLRKSVSSGEAIALLGLLNSSTACFWMKQVFKQKGSASSDISKRGFTPENDRYEFGSTGMKKFPLPEGWRESKALEVLSHRLVNLANTRAALQPAAVVTDWLESGAMTLSDRIQSAERQSLHVEREMHTAQEELDWVVYALYGLTSEMAEPLDAVPIEHEHRPFCWPSSTPPDAFPNAGAVRAGYSRRRAAIEAGAPVSVIETPVFKRLWRGRQGVFGRYDRTYSEHLQRALQVWLVQRVDAALEKRSRPATIEQVTAILQDDPETLAVCRELTGRPDFSLSALVGGALRFHSVPSHPLHTYTARGLVKREAWDATRRHSGVGGMATLPLFKSTDFMSPVSWRLRGKLDVPLEWFVAVTEHPDARTAEQTPYLRAAWTPAQKLRAILEIDEELEDAGVATAFRAGLLDTAWRLIPVVAAEEPEVGQRLRAELSALTGPGGVSREVLVRWQQSQPGPAEGHGSDAAGVAAVDTEDEESDES